MSLNKKLTNHGVRVAYVTQWFSPEFVLVVTAIAKSLASRGNQVHVLTGNPNFPDGKVHDGYNAWRLSRETIDGLPVQRTPLYPSHDSSAAKRILNYVSWAFSATIFGYRTIRCADVALVYSSPATAALPAMVWRRIAKTPYVLLIQDVWPDSVTASGFVSNRTLASFVHGVLNYFVNWSYRSAEHIVVISSGMKDLLMSRGVPDSKLSVVYNWADESHPSLSQKVGIDVREKFGLPNGSFVVTYAGNHGAAQGLDSVIEAAQCLQGEVTFLFIGDGGEKARLTDLAAELNCTNVIFMDPVSPTEVGWLQEQSDVQLVSLTADPIFGVTMPSKVQSIFCGGHAVIAIASGNVATVVQRAGAGWTAEPGNVEEITNVVRSAAQTTPAIRRAMGESAQQFYRHNMSELIGGNLLSEILVKAANKNEPKESSHVI